MSLNILILALTVLSVARAGKLFYEVRSPAAEDESLLCPDQKSKCPNSASCCQMGNGQWGCCPFKHASCCSDNEHCCPQGYTCNTEKGNCYKHINNDTIPWAKKVVSSVDAKKPSSNMLCPDYKSSCPSGAACCRTYSGTYRCCAYPNNVCCSDGLSCCPRCTVCDLNNHQCIPAVATEQWSSLTPSSPSVENPKITPAAIKALAEVIISETPTTTPAPNGKVQCDATHYCSGSQTCCWLPSGVWGCCPYTYATCCVGSYFCCPQGKRCTNPPGGCF